MARRRSRWRSPKQPRRFAESNAGPLRRPPHHQLLGPIVRAPWHPAGDESRVAAGARDEELNRARRRFLRSSQRFERQEWIVLRTDAEHGRGDRVQERKRAGAFVVIFSVAKSEQRRGRGVVEFAKRAGTESARNVELDSESLHDRNGFLSHRPKKLSDIQRTCAALELRRAGGEVVRHGHRCRCPYDLLRRMLTKPLQKDIAAERSANADDRQVLRQTPE